MYRLADIEIVNVDNNKYIEKKSGLDVLIINNKFIGIDTIPTSITGNQFKLNKLGWIPKFSIDDILYEYILD